MALIVLRKYYNYIHANIALGLLESRDITCFLENEKTSTIYPIATSLNGNIKLVVEENDAEHANEILKETEV